MLSRFHEPPSKDRFFGVHAIGSRRNQEPGTSLEPFRAPSQKHSEEPVVARIRNSVSCGGPVIGRNLLGPSFRGLWPVIHGVIGMVTT